MRVIGLLGTAFTMEQDFYVDRPADALRRSWTSY
jgi:aspartate/glutamate racemase